MPLVVKMIHLISKNINNYYRFAATVFHTPAVSA